MPPLQEVAIAPADPCFRQRILHARHTYSTVSCLFAAVFIRQQAAMHLQEGGQQGPHKARGISHDQVDVA